MKLRLFIPASGLIGAALIVASCGGGGAAPTATKVANGQAVFAITDAAADMGSVTGIQVTVSGVKVHQQGGAWVDVSSQQQNFDLLQLHAHELTALLAQVNLHTGTYDQMELDVSKVVVTDGSGTHGAKLPSGKLQFKGLMEVQAGGTSTATFDIIADQSLHVTGNSEYILAPVINLDVRTNAQAQVGADNAVTVNGGTSTTKNQVGMNADGAMDNGLRIGPDAVLEVDAAGKVKQTKGHALATGTIQSVDPSKGTVTLKLPSGTTVTLNVSSDAVLKSKGAEATLAALANRPGGSTIAEFDADNKGVSRLDVDDDDTAKADFGANLTLKGAIKSVDPTSGKVTITAPSGVNVVVNLGKDGKLQVGGAAVDINGLGAKVGSDVETQVDANSHAPTTTIRGTLKAATATTVTVTTDAGDITLKINPDSKMNVNGARATLADLQAAIGAGVTVRYENQDQALDDLESSGQIKPTSSGQATPTAGTTAQPTATSSAPATPAAGTSAQASPAPSATPAAATVTINGKLKSVSVSGNTVTVTVQNSTDLVLNVTAQSQIRVRNAASALTALVTAIGSEVSVTYNGQTKVIVTLDVNG